MAYLLCTPLQAVNWFDFHIQAFIPIFFLMMFYFYVRKEFKASFAFFLLTLSTIEIMPVLLFPFGVYCLINNRNERKALMFGGSIMCVSILWFSLGTFVKASLNPMYESTFGAWSIWGSSYTQMLTSVATRPIDMLVYFFTAFALEKGLYFIWLMAPVLFLPLFARKEFVLLVMPWITMVFLSTYAGYFTNQYAAFVVPQLFVAVIFGLKVLSKSVEHISFRKSLIMRYSKWLLWASIASFILIGPFGIVSQTRSVYIHGLPQDTLNKQALRDALQIIPDNATVYTSFQIEPHLANRLAVYANSVPETPPDYIVIDIRLPDSSTSLDGFGGSAIVGADQLLRRYNYALILSNDGILIYKISTNSSSSSEPITLFFNFRDLTLDAGVFIEDSSSRSSSVLMHRPEDAINEFWHGPYVALPRGVYEVTYCLKSGQTTDGHLCTLDVASELGETLLARKYLYGHDLEPNAWKNITLQFCIEQPKTFVEFRGTFASNSTTHSLDFIGLERLSPEANNTFGSISYNHKDMSVIAGNSTQRDVVFQRKGSLVPFSFGIYDRMPPGTYTIGFWLRLDDLAQGKVFSITANGFDNANLAQMEIAATDFGGKEQWKYFSHTFVATNTTSSVEIKGIGDSGASFSFSYLEIEIAGVGTTHGV
jgi:uncharacterized membrane protein